MAKDVYSVYNPEMSAPIDTVVEGIRYEIPGGETFSEIPEAHATFLQNTYPWLELSQGGKPVKTEKPAAEGEPDADGEGDEDADKALAKPARKAAAKKVAAKPVKKGKGKK